MNNEATIKDCSDALKALSNMKLDLDGRLSSIYNTMIDDPNLTCKEIQAMGKDYLTLYPDFEDCSKCSAAISENACKGQRIANFKRMTELYRKLERLVV